MDKDVAEELMKRCLALNGPINDVMESIEQISNMDERKQFRMGIAEISGSIYADLMRPIHKQYPELNPYKDEEK